MLLYDSVLGMTIRDPVTDSRLLQFYGTLLAKSFTESIYLLVVYFMILSVI
jgi:hypothetical protein